MITRSSRKNSIWKEKTFHKVSSGPPLLSQLSSFPRLTASSSLWYTADPPPLTCCIFLLSFLFQSSIMVLVSSLLAGSSSQSQFWLCPDNQFWSSSSGCQSPSRDTSCGGASQRAPPDSQGSCFQLDVSNTVLDSGFIKSTKLVVILYLSPLHIWWREQKREVIKAKRRNRWESEVSMYD